MGKKIVNLMLRICCKDKIIDRKTMPLASDFTELFPQSVDQNQQGILYRFDDKAVSSSILPISQG